MFENLLKRIAQSLKNDGIPYMVIGGQAVILDFDGGVAAQPLILRPKYFPMPPLPSVLVIS